MARLAGGGGGWGEGVRGGGGGGEEGGGGGAKMVRCREEELTGSILHSRFPQGVI
jgi:hypothetical protein